MFGVEFEGGLKESKENEGESGEEVERSPEVLRYTLSPACGIWHKLHETESLLSGGTVGWRINRGTKLPS